VSDTFKRRLQGWLIRHQWRYRAGVVSRTLAAFAGGYALTSLLVVALSLWLPMGKGDAVLTATMASFLIYTLVIMLVFSVKTALRAWLWLAGLSAVASAPWLLLLARA
jgi:hypothetical protein